MSKHATATHEPSEPNHRIEQRREPEAQGGALYHRCTSCGREALDVDQLLHARTCGLSGEL